MQAVVQEGGIGRSLLRAEWRIYAGSTFVELACRGYLKLVRRGAHG
jgi:hypothetical protein